MTTWTLLPASVLRNTARVAVSVLPSPVFISAIAPDVQDHAADQLHVVVALTQGPLAGLPAEREGLRKQVVERLAVAGPLPQLVRLGEHLRVVEQLHLGLVAIDRFDPLLVLTELLALPHPQRAIYESYAFGHPFSVLSLQGELADAGRVLVGLRRQLLSRSTGCFRRACSVVPHPPGLIAILQRRWS